MTGPVTLKTVAWMVVLAPPLLSSAALFATPWSVATKAVAAAATLAMVAAMVAAARPWLFPATADKPDPGTSDAATAGSASGCSRLMGSVRATLRWMRDSSLFRWGGRRGSR